MIGYLLLIKHPSIADFMRIFTVSVDTLANIYDRRDSDVRYRVILFQIRKIEKVSACNVNARVM